MPESEWVDLPIRLSPELERLSQRRIVTLFLVRWSVVRVLVEGGPFLHAGLGRPRRLVIDEKGQVAGIEAELEVVRDLEEALCIDGGKGDTWASMREIT